MNKNSGGSVTGTVTYYREAGAMRVDSTSYFVLKDHLGSASVITDASGTTVGEQRYYPFGETRVTTGTIPTDKLFTGQHEITGLGIYHYGARFYSPKLGRFLSPDGIIPSYSDPQDLNRFSYVGNNPLLFIDPTGHRPELGQAGKKGCSNPTYCNKGQTKSKQELAAMRREKRSEDGGVGGRPLPAPKPAIRGGQQDQYWPWAEWAKNGEVAPSWEGSMQINRVEFEKMLSVVADDVHRFSVGWYDTPFFNRYGQLKGTGCFGGQCYSRSEINYVGEGQAWAALGLSKNQTYFVVGLWKRVVYRHPPSEGVLKFTGIGWDYYHERYSEPSRSLLSIITPPGIATSLLK